MKRKPHLSKDQIRTTSRQLEIWVSECDMIAHFKICKKTLGVWHRQKGLPKYQIGRIVLYKESEVTEWIEKHRKEAMPKQRKDG